MVDEATDPCGRFMGGLFIGRMDSVEKPYLIELQDVLKVAYDIALTV